jgi:hypothetical protein
LETWLSYAEQFERAQIKTPQLDNFESFEDSKQYVPDWYRIKEGSKQARTVKAALTRTRNGAGKESAEPSFADVIRPQQTLQGAQRSQKRC